MKPFIPSSLDDYPLTPAEFRIFCHICRRDGCYEAIPKMAKHCKVGMTTTVYALKQLEACGLILASRTTGKTIVYQTADDNQWKAPPINPIRRPKGSYLGSGGSDHPRSGGSEGVGSGGSDKGNPIKAIPLRGVSAPKVNGHTRGQIEDPPAWKTEWDEMKGRL